MDTFRTTIFILFAFLCIFFVLLWDSWIIIWNSVTQMCNSRWGRGVLGSGKLRSNTQLCYKKREWNQRMTCDARSQQISRLIFKCLFFECIFWKINYEYAGTELIRTLFFLVSSRVKGFWKFQVLDGIKILILLLYKLVFSSLYVLKHSNVKGENKDICSCTSFQQSFSFLAQQFHAVCQRDKILW